MYNDVYHDDDSVFPQLVGLTTVTAAGFGLYKYSTDQSFRDKTKSVLNKISTVKKPERDRLQSEIETAYNSIRGKENTAHSVNTILREDRIKSSTEKFKGYEFSPLDNWTNEATGASPNRIGFKNAGEIVDVHGNPIANDFLDIFAEKMGLDRDLHIKNVGTRGTSLTFDVVGKTGQRESYAIPFAKQINGSWVYQDGSTSVAKLMDEAILDTKGKMISVVVDPNANMMQIFADERKFQYYNRLAKGGKGAETAARDILNLAVEELGQEYRRQAYSIKRVTNIVQQMNSLPIAGMNIPEEIGALGKQIGFSPFASHRTGQSTILGTNTADFGQDGKYASRETAVMYPEHVIGVREGREKIYWGRFSRKLNSIVPVTKPKQPQADQLHNIATHWSSSLSQSQSADFTTTYFGPVGDVTAPEALKSVKGLYYSGNIQKVSYVHTHKDYRTSSRSRNLPQYELPTIEGAEETIAKIAERGHINVPMQISPFSSEAIMISPKVKRMNVGKTIPLYLDELVTGRDGGSVSEFSNLVQKMVSDPEFRAVDDMFIKLPQGSVMGRKRRGENLRTKQEYLLSKADDMEVVTAPYNLRMSKEHINATIEYNRGKKSGEPWKIFAEYEDKQIKVGTLYGTTRGSLVDAYDNPNFDYTWRTGDELRHARALASSRNLAILPEGEMSWDLFKNVIPKLEDGKYVFGKGRGEYLSFLRSMSLGNLTESATDLIATGELLDTFKKYTNIGDTGTSVNITHAARKGLLQYTRVDDLGEAAIAYQQMAAATQMAHLSGKSSYVGSGVSSETAVKILNRTFKAQDLMSKYTKDEIIGRSVGLLPKEIQDAISSGVINAEDLQLMNYMGDMTAHEAEAMTLGKGSGIYRHTGLDLSYTADMPTALEELSARNMVRSTKLTQETRMMLMSASNELDAAAIEEFEKTIGAKIETLGVDELRAKLGSPYLQISREASSAIKSPDIFFNSLFGSDENKFGYFVKTKGKQGDGLFYIPSQEWIGGLQSLEDGSYVPAKEITYNMARALSEAAEDNTGVIKGKALEELLDQTAKDYSSFMRSSALQIEGRSYEKLVDSQFLLDTHKRLSRMKGSTAEGLDNVVGSLTLRSRDDYVSFMARQIEDAQTIAKEQTKSVVDVLNERYGAGNAITSAVEESKSGNAMKIASEMADKSASAWKNIQTEIDLAVNQTGQITEEALGKIKSLIFKHANVDYLTRYPNIYAKSTLMTLGFIAPELGNDRTMAAGHVIKSLMNADTDGDAIHAFSMIQSNNRQMAMQYFEKENLEAYKIMKQVEEGNVLKKLVKPEQGMFTALPEGYKGEFASAMKSLEIEQSRASFLTKGLTGSATVRAWGQTAYYRDVLANTQGLSDEAYTHAKYFIDTLIPKSGPQSIISSKHAKAILDRTATDAQMKHFATMGAVFENIGEITPETMSRSVAQLGEIHALGEWALMEARKPGNEKGLEALQRGGLMDDLLTVHDLQNNWRRASDTEIENLHKRGWFNRKDETLDAFKTRFNEATKDIEYFTENKLLQEAGLVSDAHYLDFIERPLKGKGFSDSVEFIEKSIREQLKRNSPNGYKVAEEEVTRLLNDQLMNLATRRAKGEDIFMTEAMRATRRAETRVFPVVDETIAFLTKHLTPKRAGIAAGAALLGFTALNLVTGDGTPRELNDIPSYNNPSFHNTQYNSMSERSTIYGGHGSNVSSSLLTNYRENSQTLMGHINSVVGLRGYNSSTIISDGSNPYKQDMYRYGG